jgi:hypothetical protein
MHRLSNNCDFHRDTRLLSHPIVLSLWPGLVSENAAHVQVAIPESPANGRGILLVSKGTFNGFAWPGLA